MELSKIKQFMVTARLDIPDEEAGTLSGDLEAILGYVDQLDEIEVSEDEIEVPAHYNVTREDVVTTVTGSYTDLLLAQTVAVQDGFVKVKQIF